MKSEDVERTIERALQEAQLKKEQHPKLLSDNGSYYVAAELKDFLSRRKIVHVHGRPGHPQTQGKIERYHRSMKNVVKLEHYYYPEELKLALSDFIEYYNHQRYHESLNNVTPADVYFGRKELVLRRREIIKRISLKKRRKNFLFDKLKTAI
jgi:transposase InsO family protein